MSRAVSASPPVVRPPAVAIATILMLILAVGNFAFMVIQGIADGVLRVALVAIVFQPLRLGLQPSRRRPTASPRRRSPTWFGMPTPSIAPSAWR